MGGRVIQGYFLSGRARPPAGVAVAQPALERQAQVRSAPGQPPPAFARRAMPVQARPAPGRPPLAHQAAGVVQPFGGVESFEVDPAKVGLGRGGGQPLPQAVLAKMETAFGADFSGVRIHVGPQATRIGAVAFTMGEDVYFAPGKYQPDSAQGQQLIGHELAHVIQQRQGRVRAPGSGVAVVQDRALEIEADRLGAQAAAYRPSGVVQRSAASPGRDLAGRPGLPLQRAQDSNGKVLLDHSKKSYRDSSGKRVSSPGSTGYVCAPTFDGSYELCKWFSRRVFESMNDLSAPGQSSYVDYGRPSNLRGDPSIVTTSSPVDPSKFTVFDPNK